ncbi:Toxin Afp18 [Pandoraea iniqua]|nr:Toxin Afp18 [Pandoraea iniqua]
MIRFILKISCRDIENMISTTNIFSTAFPIHPSNAGAAPPDAALTGHPSNSADHTIFQTLLVDLHVPDAGQWAQRMAQACARHPGLRTSLILALTQTPLGDIARWLDADNDPLVQTLNDHADLADGILASLERALSTRRPYESLEEIVARVTSRDNLRDIRRSFDRDDVRRQREFDARDGPFDVGHRWKQDLCNTFIGLRMAGTGHDPWQQDRDYEAIARALAAEMPAGPDHPAWHKHGAIGVLTGLLYALGGAKTTFDAIGDCLMRVVDSVGTAVNAPLPADPLVFATAQGAVIERSTALPQPLRHALHHPLRHHHHHHRKHDVHTHSQGSHADGVSAANPHHVHGHRRHQRRHLNETHTAEHSPLAPSTTIQRLITLATTQIARHEAQFDFTARVANITDWSQLIRKNLAAAATPGRTPFDSDQWFLNRFRFFYPSKENGARAGQMDRGGLEESTKLTQAALQYFGSGEALGGADVEFGIYAHGAPRLGHYQPSDESTRLSVRRLMQTIHASRSVPLRTLDAMRSHNTSAPLDAPLYRHRVTMLAYDAELEYAAGQLSQTGLILAQLVAYAPSAAQRIASDSNLAELQGYTLDVQIPGRNGLSRPGGMFAVSQSARTATDNGGRVILYAAGSTAPLREYASIGHLVQDFARGKVSGAYGDMMQRLPLSIARDVMNGTVCTISLTATDGDLVHLSLASSAEVIGNDMRRAGRQLVSGERRTAWTHWLAGVPSTDFEAELERPAPQVTGFKDPLPPPQQLHIRLETMQQVRAMTDLRASVSAALPDLRRGAVQYAAQLVEDMSGASIDAAKVYMHVYATHIGQGPIANPPWKTVQASGTATLDQIVLDIAQGERETTLSANTEAIFSLDSEPHGARALLLGSLTPVQLLARIDAGQFVTQQGRRLDTFWNTHEGQVRSALKSAFVMDAFLQGHDHSLGAEGVDIARRIARCERMDLLDLDHLPEHFAVAGSHLQTAWLRIGGAISDIQEFTDLRNGWILIYTPRLLANSVKEFPDRRQLSDWVRAQARDPNACARLLSCFSQADRRDEKAPGVDAVLAAIDIGASTPRKIFPSETFVGDPFSEFVHVFRQRTRDEIINPRVALPDNPQAVIVSRILQTLAMLNWMTGFGIVVDAPVPGLLEANVILSFNNIAMGGTTAVLGDDQTRPAGWASLMAGIAGGIPIGYHYKASLTFQDEVQLFINRTPFAQLKRLMPNLYRSEAGFVATSGDARFDVEYYPTQGTWRLTDPTGLNGPGPAISQTSTYEWVLDAETPAAESPAPVASSVFHDDISRNFVDVEFRAKSAALANAVVDADREAFLAGKIEAGASPLQWDASYRPADLLKLDFTDPAQKDPRLLGILARRINDALRFESTQRAIANARIVAEDVRAAGGIFEAFTQTAYVNSNADGHTGFCLPLTRAMAAALHIGRDGAFIGNLRRAIASPQSEAAIRLRDNLVALHSNVQANRLELPLHGMRSGENALNMEQLFRLFTAGHLDMRTYVIKTRAHAMSVTVGTRASWFYDANFGLARFSTPQQLAVAFATHLTERGLGRLYRSYGTADNLLFLVDTLQTQLLRHVELRPGVTVNDILKPML